MKKTVKNVSFLTALSGVVCLLSASLGTAYAGLSHRSVMHDIETMHIVSDSNTSWSQTGKVYCPPAHVTDVTFPTTVQGGPSAANAVIIPTGSFDSCSTTYQTTQQSSTGTHTVQCIVKAYFSDDTDMPTLQEFGAAGNHCAKNNGYIGQPLILAIQR